VKRLCEARDKGNSDACKKLALIMFEDIKPVCYRLSSWHGFEGDDFLSEVFLFL